MREEMERKKEKKGNGLFETGAELFEVIRGLPGATPATERRRHLVCDVRRIEKLARRRD